ncbi:MAG: hypothetical protein WCW47_03845 [Candidatus Paceibacterota bacterium]|jgi:hypothetical protein
MKVKTGNLLAVSVWGLSMPRAEVDGGATIICEEVDLFVVGI